MLARRLSEEEAEERGLICRPAQGKLEEWVLPWLIATYEGTGTTTLEIYKRHWRMVGRFLREERVSTAGEVRREHAAAYMAWRIKKGGGRNVAIQELKFLGMVLREAIARGQLSANPLSRLGLKKDAVKEKMIWGDEEIQKAAAHFEREGSHWMQCAFYFGLFQAARLRQCQLPLEAIDLKRGVIEYPDKLVKGRKGYSQPIDERFLPILKRLVGRARELGSDVLCVVPWDASLRLRRALDYAGCEGLVHHGLRATWITRAARAGVAESLAMAFCHHESREVHRIYKRLSAISVAHVPALLSLPELS